MNRLRPVTEQGKVAAHNSQPDNRTEKLKTQYINADAVPAWKDDAGFN
jgi:hypothetical protein